MIQCYDDFIGKLLETGFTIGGENGEGVFTLSDSFTDRIRWHTEELDTDPWEWRMRVLQERDDIAYGKVFFQEKRLYYEGVVPVLFGCAPRRRDARGGI